jgi:hypothetical protein
MVYGSAGEVSLHPGDKSLGSLPHLGYLPDENEVRGTVVLLFHYDHECSSLQLSKTI